MTDNQEPSEIEMLLPWYAAGTLNAGEARRVEDALAQDPELARRYREVSEEFGATMQLNESLGVPSARPLDALFAKIDAEPARRQARSFDIIGRFSAVLDGLSARTRAWTAAVAAAVIAIEGGVLGVLANQAASPIYQVASVSEPASAPGAYILVRFAQEAHAADITAFLDANHASIASGPAAGGFYRLQVAGKTLPKDKLAAIAKRFQQAKLLEFVAVTK